MPSSFSAPVQVEFTPEFKRNLRQLAKKYRHIHSDVRPIIAQLEAGERPGDQIPGTRYPIFKVRVRNRDIQKGKSSGYRVIWYLATQQRVVLVTIYSKLDQADISAEQIRQIVEELGS